MQQHGFSLFQFVMIIKYRYCCDAVRHASWRAFSFFKTPQVLLGKCVNVWGHLIYTALLVVTIEKWTVKQNQNEIWQCWWWWWTQQQQE